MLPKLELAPMRMYLRMLAKTFRPSSTPSSSTSRSFSSRMASADSLAISTAVSTEMPTSAARRAGASLMPSPRNPTTCPAPCRVLMTRCLWAGDSRANRVALSAASASSASDIPSTWLPSSTWSVAMPTSRQILRLTSSLSPVSTLTEMPCSLECGDRRPGGVLGRVEEGHVTAQDQVALVVLGIGRFGLQVPVGQREDPEAVGAELVELLFQIAGITWSIG